MNTSNKVCLYHDCTSGEIVVILPGKDLNDTTNYFTADPVDAQDTAKAMAKDVGTTVDPWFKEIE